jgi:hypothetical protein
MATAKETKAVTVHLVGHVKHNVETGAVAVRTVFDAEQFPNMVWLIATTGMGAQNAGDRDVEGWDDLFTPPEPVEPQGVIVAGETLKAASGGTA